MTHYKTSHKDSTHDLLPAEMATFGGGAPLSVVDDVGKKHVYGYTCMIRGVPVLALETYRAGGIIPDWIVVCPLFGAVRFVEAKSPKAIRKKAADKLLETGQALLAEMIGRMFVVYETSFQARQILLEVSGNQDYDDPVLGV